MLKRLAVGLCAALAAGCAGHSLGSELAPAGAGRELSDRLRLGELVVVLEETELTGVQRRFGGVVRDSGDAHGARAWLCYEVPDPNGPVTVVLDSPEIGGSRWIMGYKLFRPPAVDPDTGCTQLPLRMDDIVLDKGLHLGMRRVELERRFGAPTLLADTLRFQSFGRISGKSPETGESESWDRVRTIDVRLDGDSVAWLQSWKFTTS